MFSTVFQPCFSILAYTFSHFFLTSNYNNKAKQVFFFHDCKKKYSVIGKYVTASVRKANFINRSLKNKRWWMEFKLDIRMNNYSYVPSIDIDKSMVKTDFHYYKIQYQLYLCLAIDLLYFWGDHPLSKVKIIINAFDWTRLANAEFNQPPPLLKWRYPVSMKIVLKINTNA